MTAAYEGARNIDRRLRGGCHVSSAGVCDYVANQDLNHAIGRTGRAVGSVHGNWPKAALGRADVAPDLRARQRAKDRQQRTRGTLSQGGDSGEGVRAGELDGRRGCQASVVSGQRFGAKHSYAERSPTGIRQAASHSAFCNDEERQTERIDGGNVAVRVRSPVRG